MKQSSFYQDYKTARDKAWEIIFKYHVNTLPVPIHDLCARMKIRLFSYTAGGNLIKKYRLEGYLKNDGFATILQNNYVIFYDDTIPTSRKRFTIAHEVGHIVLGHIYYENIACRSAVTIWNKGEDAVPNRCESAANIFASRLLAPACVLWKLDIHSVKEIEMLCGLSKQAAQIRAKRMQTLYQQNHFIYSALEKKALQQFSGFIAQQEQKKAGLKNTSGSPQI